MCSSRTEELLTKADSQMDLESLHWDKYLHDWSAGLALEMPVVSEELKRERNGNKDHEDSDQVSERTVRNKRPKFQGPTEANVSEELKNKDQEDSDQGSEGTVRDKCLKRQGPKKADPVSPSEPFFEARETRTDEALKPL